MSTKSVFLSLFLFIGGLTSCQQDDPLRAEVISEIRGASKLSTVEYVFSKMVMGSNEVKLLKIVPLTGSFFLARTEATVKVGIDLSKIDHEDVIIEGNRITVKVPEVEVINFSYPAEKFEVDTVLTEQKFFSRLDPRTLDDFYLQAELEIRKQINALPMRETAQQKTRIFLEGLMRKAGFTEVYVEFDTAQNDLLELPKVPQAWISND